MPGLVCSSRNISISQNRFLSTPYGPRRAGRTRNTDRPFVCPQLTQRSPPVDTNDTNGRPDRPRPAPSTFPTTAPTTATSPRTTPTTYRRRRSRRRTGRSPVPVAAGHSENLGNPGRHQHRRPVLGQLHEGRDGRPGRRARADPSSE